MEDFELHIVNDIREMHRLNEALQGLGSKWQLPDGLLMNVNLVLEEIISNIIFYAYEDNTSHGIMLKFSKSGNELIIKVEDDGRPFDITGTGDFGDREKAAEDREVGGLGIHFVKTLMDRVAYERKDGLNVLTLYKNIKQ